MYTEEYVEELFRALKTSDARKVTKYVNRKHRVTMTRTFKRDRRNTRETFVLTYGAPNYEDREFIKAAVKAKEPFPIKKLQFKFYPQKK